MRPFRKPTKKSDRRPRRKLSSGCAAKPDTSRLRDGLALAACGCPLSSPSWRQRSSSSVSDALRKTVTAVEWNVMLFTATNKMR